MANFRPPRFTKYDGNYIKTQRLIFDSISFEEYPGGSIHFLAFFSIDGCMCRSDSFIATGLNFDKNKTAFDIRNDKVNFTISAAIIARDCFIAFGFEMFLAAFFTPPAQLLRVSQQPSPVERQDKHQANPLSGYSVVTVSLCEPDTLTTPISEEVEFGASGLAASQSLYIDDIG